ncbi:putative zinc phosphodiesterase [Schistosoma mansoni]|uniref:putative zinc phosphodiesterase n=2 Tax=Schistosoma mansoni TaxID=6183 RepID=UPI00022DC723|nr:putative zinc phosphodiesterase [Schistosoma mansoni]|eukprot:XP_018653897.1 putative zinc phosphodiesterase [Schistosoma mansoni]
MLRPSLCYVRLITTPKRFLKHKRPEDRMIPPPHSISLTVVGNGRAGSSKSMLIDTGVCRYLVNCGESTQRVLAEYRMKASRIQHVFLTRMSWDCTSGLLGVALTAKAAGVKKLTIHGPPELERLMQLTRPFTNCKTTDIVMSEIHKKFYKRRKENLDHVSESSVFMYYFQPFRTRRKLIMSKFNEACIPASVLKSGEIQTVINGENLILSDGRIISPDEVTAPSPPSKNMLFIDCPNSDYIPAFISNEEFFNSIQAEESNENLTSGVSLVVHFTPPGMFYSNQYQKFVQKLEECALRKSDTEDPTTTLKHLVLDGTGYVTDRVGMYSQTFILNRFFDSKVYPLLFDMADSDTVSKRNETISKNVDPFSSVVTAEPYLQFSLRPWTGFNKPTYPQLNGDEFVSQIFDPIYMSLQEAEEQFVKMRESIESNKPPAHRLASEAYPEITFLGTASSSPNKYRNISCILMQLDPDNYIMLDCGEGSLSQLYALHGVEKGNDILRKLRLILVTHMHADHHGGVFTVALVRSNLLKSDGIDQSNCLLPVLTPSEFCHWLTNFNKLFHYDQIVDPFIIPIIYDKHDKNSNPSWVLNMKRNETENWLKLLEQLDINIRPVKVPHTRSSWAFIIDNPYPFKNLVNSKNIAENCSEIQRKWSIVYSGDTPSCPELVRAGKNCDLLIHEATVNDEYVDLAVKAKHSTTSQAIQAGRDMNASFILLNHFSQRYGRVPPIDEFKSDVAASFDFMTVKFSDLQRLPYYIPYYQYAFAKHWNMARTKADSYTYRKLREADELLESEDGHCAKTNDGVDDYNRLLNEQSVKG